MFLNRLRIRGKLAALIVLPLVVIAALSATVAISQIRDARAAGHTVSSVNIGSRVGVIVADLQSERLDAAGYLIGQATAGDFAARSADVDEQVSDLRHDDQSTLSPVMRNALAAVATLAPLRTEVAAKTATPTSVLAGYRSIINQLIDATRLIDGIDTGTASGREVVALDSLLHIDELTNESAAILLELAGSNDNLAPPSQQALISYAADRTAIAQLLPRFAAYAAPDQVSLHNQVTAAFDDRLGPDFTDSFTVNPAATVRVLSPPVVYPQMQSFVVLGHFAEQKIAADVVTAVDNRRDQAMLTAYLTGALGIIVVALVAILGVAIARSVSRPLTRLTSSTNRVARLAEAELLRVADDEADETEPIGFDPVRISTNDEIGELAQAFARVSRTSIQLVSRQVVSRRNVAQMFGHVGRRTQNLVGRQIALIDTLEAQETDGPRLADLYRLDHLTSRLRRNASSLVALSGTNDPGAHFSPLPLVDVIRLALGEIEEYTRIDVATIPGLMIAPGAINDLILVLAELMENATTFSPPHTRVTVSTTESGRITIVDHGIGLAPDRMHEENSRLAQRERLDLVPTEVLGLFVVGRLARRHGLGVVLTDTPDGGVTVTVDVRTCVIEAEPVLPLASAPTSTLFDAQSIDRATRAIEAIRPWRAFELPTPALPAGPSGERDPDAAAHLNADRLDPDRSDINRASTDESATGSSGTSSSGTSSSGIDGFGIDESHTNALDQPPGVIDPRITMEWSAVGSDPSTTAPLPRRSDWIAHRRSLTNQPAGGTDDAGRGARPDDAQTVVLPAVRGSLTRRVPGATMSLDQPPTTRQNVAPQDPDEVLALVQQFESGVARALRDVRDETTEEDATQ